MTWNKACAIGSIFMFGLAFLLDWGTDHLVWWGVLALFWQQVVIHDEP